MRHPAAGSVSGEFPHVKEGNRAVEVGHGHEVGHHAGPGDRGGRPVQFQRARGAPAGDLPMLEGFDEGAGEEPVVIE